MISASGGTYYYIIPSNAPLGKWELKLVTKNQIITPENGVFEVVSKGMSINFISPISLATYSRTSDQVRVSKTTYELGEKVEIIIEPNSNYVGWLLQIQDSRGRYVFQQMVSARGGTYYYSIPLYAPLGNWKLKLATRSQTATPENGVFDVVRQGQEQEQEQGQESNSVTIISPNGGEKWKQGQTYDIKWNFDIGDYGVERTYIYLEDHSGNPNCFADKTCGKWIFIGYGNSDINSYSWKILTDQDLGTKFKIFFVAQLKKQGSRDYIYYYGRSDDYFSIVSSTQPTQPTQPSDGPGILNAYEALKYNK